MNSIGILGSTGSIGTQTLEIARNYHDEIQVAALAAGTNVTLLEQQIREFKPRMAALWSEDSARDLPAHGPVRMLQGVLHRHAGEFRPRLSAERSP